MKRSNFTLFAYLFAAISSTGFLWAADPGTPVAEDDPTIPDLSEFDRDELHAICEQLYKRIHALESENDALKEEIEELRKDAPPKTFIVTITDIIEVDTSELHAELKPLQYTHDREAGRLQRDKAYIESREKSGGVNPDQLRKWKDTHRKKQLENSVRLKEVRAIEKRIKDAEETTTFNATMNGESIEILARRQYQKLAEELEVGKAYEIEGTLATAGRTTKTIIIRGIHSSIESPRTE